MDLFRRKQKLIFWAVTIIIVPSFVAVWGVGGRYANPDSASIPEVATIDGEPLAFPEFDAFRKRLQAAVGGLPVQIAGLPDTDSGDAQIWKYVFAYALLKDAEKADTRVSDLQVGTFLDRHPAAAGAADRNDPKARASLVDNFCRQMQISRSEFLRGVREWNAIGNYLSSDANLAAVNDDTVFAFYAMNKAECVVKRIRVPVTEVDRAAAMAELEAKPPEDLDRDIREHIRANADDPKYRKPSAWRLAYVLVPFIPSASAPRPGEEEITARYEADKASAYAGKTPEEGRELAAADLLREEIERQTLRNLTIDVDPQLREQGGELSLDELGKLTQLAKYGAVTGDTGPEALDAEAVIARLPAGTPFTLRFFLEQLDARREVLADAIGEWRRGFNLEGRPVKADAGFFRFRIVEYVPSEPLDVEDEAGNVLPAIWEAALTDLAGKRADELTAERAAETESRLRALLDARERGEEPPDRETAEEYDALESEIIPYASLPEDRYQLGRLPVGDIFGPEPYTNGPDGSSGLEMVVMAERRLPHRDAFQAEPAAERDWYLQRAVANFRGMASFTFSREGYPVALIQPSPAVMAGLADRFNREAISINRSWLGNGGQDG